MNNEQYIANLESENLRLVRKCQQLLADCHRLDAARQAAVTQCAAMVEEIETLKKALNEVMD